jgi:DNA gyrase subunit B
MVEGLNYLWRSPNVDNWFLIIGILGHAFIVSAVIAASFHYFIEATKVLSVGDQPKSESQHKHIIFYFDIIINGVTRLTKQPLSYNANDIQVLEGLEAVRRRPGMYVGGTDIKALHHLIYEVVDNSIDEALAGSCDSIQVIINEDESVTVIDNGRGIPVDIHPERKVSALEVVMTTLHAGGKFSGTSYKVSGGLHGVGVSAVNALSEWCEVEVYRDGKIYFQRYEKGSLKHLSKLWVRKFQNTNRNTTSFKYDTRSSKMESTYKFELLAQRFREMAFVTRAVTIKLEDKREDKQVTFYFEGGISSFVKYLNRNRDTLHDVFYFEKEIEDIGVEVAIQFTDSYSESVYAFANTINTIDGGTHLTGLRIALTRSINDFARKNNLLKILTQTSRVKTPAKA